MKASLNFKIRNRQALEKVEETTLAPYAKASQGIHSSRRFEEPEHGYRTAFQRDRDRIIHSRAFRRLKHKRQVFLTTESDHYRTRITHTLEVAQLSRTIARTLGLNEDLVEAISLGHDLGHTPFGHLGEVVLHEIMSGKSQLQGQVVKQDFGGFKHNYQSVRIVDELEMKYSFAGLNLTAPVREGILKHTRLKRGEFNFPDFCYEGLHFEQDMAVSIEGQVVAISDEIAQRTHDLEDGMRAGLVELKQIQELQIIKDIEKKLRLFGPRPTDKLVYQGLLIRALINHLVDDVIKNTLKNLSDFFERKKRLNHFDEEIVRFSVEMDPLQKQLNKFIYKKIIDFSRVQWSDELGAKLLFRLFEAYFQYPDVMPRYMLERYFHHQNKSFDPAAAIDSETRSGMQLDGRFLRLICDYIAGMTDYYALRETERLARLNKFQTDDLHLDSALGSPV